MISNSAAPWMPRRSFWGGEFGLTSMGLGFDQAPIVGQQLLLARGVRLAKVQSLRVPPL